MSSVVVHVVLVFGDVFEGFGHLDFLLFTSVVP